MYISGQQCSSCCATDRTLGRPAASQHMRTAKGCTTDTAGCNSNVTWIREFKKFARFCRSYKVSGDCRQPWVCVDARQGVANVLNNLVASFLLLVQHLFSHLRGDPTPRITVTECLHIGGLPAICTRLDGSKPAAGRW